MQFSVLHSEISAISFVEYLNYTASGSLKYFFIYIYEYDRHHCHKDAARQTILKAQNYEDTEPYM